MAAKIEKPKEVKVYCTDCEDRSIAMDVGYGLRCVSCGGGRVVLRSKKNVDAHHEDERDCR